MIDSTASIEKKREMLAHELAHFLTDTLYDINAATDEIKEKEKIANEFEEVLLNEKSCNAIVFRK